MMKIAALVLFAFAGLSVPAQAADITAGVEIGDVKVVVQGSVDALDVVLGTFGL